MNQKEFLAILKAERAEFEKLLAAVGIDRMEIPGVSGFYSMKDILAHFEAYERALVIWLKEARAGRVYVDDVLDQPDVNARNAIVYEANKDRDVVEVIETFRRTWEDLEACVADLTDEELTDAERTAWFVVPRWQRKQELWRCIANDSYEHHQQHIPDIERWLAEHSSMG
ncbi:ClbS/DfsB family four-helix bundle protein [Thermoflexus sp.]|uniref:ClbS/DfsB family four-helix bundle protein n=1 Tax=Thermoflexus sp. TaxID=1969742 RepID=UPI0035E3F5B3